MSGPLKGISVLDLTQMVAGPLCTMLLADLGADVIKVEPPGGDALRHTGETFVGGSRESEGFLSANRNKRSVVLDLKNERDRTTVRELAALADVLIENYRPGAIERMGLRYEDLARENPGLIFCSINGFGRAGPNHARPALDQIIQALSGIMQLTGTEESGPLRTGFPYADIIAPLLGTVGIVSALHARNQSGRGQRIDISMMNSAIFGMIPREGYFFATGNTPSRIGNKHYQVVPCNTYETADGKSIMLIAHQPKFWDALVKALDDRDLGTDPRFATNETRLKHRAEIEDRLTKHFRSATLDAWAERLDAAGALFAPVRTWPEVFADPMVRNEMLVNFDHPTAGRITVLGNPIQFSDTPVEMRRPPPTLGEHTDEVLRDLRGARSAKGQAKS